MNNIKYLILVTLISTGLACGTAVNPRAGIDPENGAQASSLIQSSFSVSGKPLLSVNKADIVIKKSALEKEFLMQTQITTQIQAPKFNGHKSRVVYFRLKNDKLYLMEAVQGHTATNDIPLNLILTEFPVVSQNDEDIILDFNGGMSRLFISEDWRAHDFGSKQYSSSEFTSVKVETSYIDKAEILPSNKLMITQVAKLSEDSANFSNENIVVQVKYYITPYNPDKSFIPTPYADFDQFGFFEVAPQLNVKGGTLVRSTKFHPEKPIVFAISSNTPSEYKDSVRDGILYWNKAFGKEIIKVVDAPKGVNAPDFNYNIVQWINYDDAGSAYADAQMDPRSGQILHAQVFMTSAFAFSSKWKAQKLSKTFTINKNNKKKNNITLKGFKAEEHCSLEINSNFINSITHLLTTTSDDSAYLKASQDYIREVIAHEVGHTLGLRHNFAGSLAINYPLDQRKELFKNYLQTKQLAENIIPSNSVMEYSPFIEAAFTGDIIAKSKAALEYDTKAIEALYLQKTFKYSETPVFCTDSHLMTGTYSDCKQFDLGSSLVEYVKYAQDDETDALIYNIINSFVNAKLALFDEKQIPIEKVFLSPASMATLILENRSSLIEQFRRGGKLLSISRRFPSEDQLNEDQIRNARLDYLESEIKKYVSLKNIFKFIKTDFAEVQYQRFENAINNNPSLLKGIGPNQKPFEFTDDEIRIIKSKTKAFLVRLQEELNKEDIKSLVYDTNSGKSKDVDYESDQKLADHAVSNQLLEVIGTRINEYVFSKTGNVWTGEIQVEEKEEKKDDKKEEPKDYIKKEKKYKKVSVTLPEFKYKFVVRNAASKLLSSLDSAPNFVWGRSESLKFSEDFAEFLKTTFNTASVSKLLPTDMPPEAAQWFVENTKIMENLK